MTCNLVMSRIWMTRLCLCAAHTELQEESPLSGWGGTAAAAATAARRFQVSPEESEGHNNTTGTHAPPGVMSPHNRYAHSSGSYVTTTITRQVHTLLRELCHHTKRYTAGFIPRWVKILNSTSTFRTLHLYNVCSSSRKRINRRKNTDLNVRIYEYVMNECECYAYVARVYLNQTKAFLYSQSGSWGKLIQYHIHIIRTFIHCNCWKVRARLRLLTWV